MNDDRNERVVAEFTQQAHLYAQSPELNDEKALEVLGTIAGVCESDTVLDVACGPGVVSCYVARFACNVIGIDLTPAMIEKARELQASQGVTNVEWRIGDVAVLPFSDDAFSLVLSRYAFHHLRDAHAVLREMRRVCLPSGKIVIADVCLPDDLNIVQSFNRLEQLRDSSHVHAFSASEFQALFDKAGVRKTQTVDYHVEFELENLLAGSTASEQAKEMIRRNILESLQNDRVGMSPTQRAEQVRVSYPISVFVVQAR
jgi:ubiquinone/menaquinone biosynthesis C-methylase UbiE